MEPGVSSGPCGRPISELGQTEKNSARAHVFRFALELGHCSTQSACLKAISGDCRHLSTNLVVRERPSDCTIAPVLGSFSAIISSYFSFPGGSAYRWRSAKK